MRVLFSEAHNELLSLLANSRDNPSSLVRLLEDDLGFTTKSIDALTAEHLKADQILVLGAPCDDLDSDERRCLKQFVEAGGGMLVFLSNSEMIVELLPELAGLLNEMGLTLKEYHNYQYNSLPVVQPHSITANVGTVQVSDIMVVQASHQAVPLIFTRTSTTADVEPMMACAEFGNGRVAVIGDVTMASDRCVNARDNAALLANTMRWLSRQNPIDIVGMDIPETVEYGQKGRVVLQVRNSHQSERPDLECTLTSDGGAIIPDPVRQNYAIPPGKTVPIQWHVLPQFLGDQELRLILNAQTSGLFRFDQLPEMRCVAPGHLAVEIRNDAGERSTTFKTGDLVTVRGALHHPDPASTDLPYAFNLEFGEGLIEMNSDPEQGEWTLKAVEAGEHQITLNIAGTGQALPALVTVQPSERDRLAELRAAYVRPLEAEITERLRLVDERLTVPPITDLPFELLSPQKFIEEVDRDHTSIIAWFRDILKSAYREQWDNPDLLDTVLSHFAPTFLPERGSYIPYAPKLASALGSIHPQHRKTLEYNLLCSQESDELTIKQHLAAYLLHEKFGHGFFYAQTRLGRQLAILERHGFPSEPKRFGEYRDAARLIRDSAIVVNEGFAAWLELTFLGKLDREVRQAVPLRQIYLMQHSTGLIRDRIGSKFFEVFPPRSASRYREGFEYLEQIALQTRIRCALCLYVLATDIDFGVTETNGEIAFTLQANAIHKRLTKKDHDAWCSHARLYRIAHLLYRKYTEVKTILRHVDCAGPCHQSSCPLKTFVLDELQLSSGK